MPDDVDLLRRFCSLPTAAFLEDAVLDEVDAWAKRRRNVTIETDRYGNRLLQTKAGKGPRLVMVAHADHPAFVSQETEDGLLHAEFRGGVYAECCPAKTAVRFFTDAGEVIGRVVEAKADEKQRLIGATLRLPRGKSVPVGCVGMFDFGRTPTKLVKDRLLARACDDLAGLAAGLEALDQVRGRKPKAPVAMLVTRAEEVGLVGAIVAAKQRRGGLLRKDDRLISIETSAAQAAAPLGGGCVLRVGDRTSIFDPAFTRFLDQIGQDLAKKNDGFQFRRALMPGGTCEATAFAAFGYTTAAVCVPLGGYHNMRRSSGKSAAAAVPEEIRLSDWTSLVALLVAAGLNGHAFDPKQDDLRDRLAERVNRLVPLFDDPTAPMQLHDPA
jgi:endoglucanase